STSGSAYMSMPTAAELTAKYGESDRNQPPGSNDAQAEHAKRILEEWGDGPFLDAYGLRQDIDESDPVDLVTAVMHFVTKHGDDPDQMIADARRHFIHEVGEGYRSE
ncbi:MAG TPA: hypothetical protein VIK61_01305, partial [Acidimicrobiia bacterium]